ncbi:MAG: hypothetical protein KatS3mg054_1072 [Chloroflexus sp.]|nr:MAG: hypothetical protein KatS3mg054_1072 [Chloroflexus sp.]
MCYRRNTGNKCAYQRLLTKWLLVSKTAILLRPLCLGSVLIIGALFLHGCYRAVDSSPWFGRGQNLPRAPITVLTGLIDLDKGIVGVLELDMKRKQVEALLGKPLVGEIPTEKALQLRVDPEDVANNLYGGVFAWVHYNYLDEVISIEFMPRALRGRMGLEQQLLVRVGDRLMVFSSRTHRRAVEGFLRGIRVRRLRDYGHYMVLEFEESSCSIHFDRDGYFESLSIVYTG